MAFALTYLSVLDKCAKQVHSSQTYKGWAITYTLLGILRATTHYKDFVSLRCLYKGGDMGEGIIKHLRPFSPTGIREGWAKTVILNYYRNDVLVHLKKGCSLVTNQSLSTYENTIDQKSFLRYGSKVEIRDRIQKRGVISVL